MEVSRDVTSTDRLAEMAAEIERQRRRIEHLESEIAAMHGTPERPALSERPMRPWASGDERLHMLEAETDRLRARILEIEAIITVGAGTMGTLQQPTPDEPTTITHNIPPSAPPHDER